MSKRLILFLLPALLLAGCNDEKPKNENDETHIKEDEEEIEGSQKVVLTSSSYGISKTINILYDENTFRGDSKVFDKNLALFEFLFVLDAHDDGLCYYKSDEPTAETDNLTFLSKAGYENIQEYHIISSDSNDVNDTTSIVIGSKVYDTNQVDINVAILGTQSNSEWDSNLDVGSSNQNYEDITGTHPEWTNKKNHKGFDVAANRVANKITSYISTYITIASPEFHYVITGYSRGAAIANILGASLEDGTSSLSRKDSRTYTFATPNTTDDTNASNYKTIFNYINDDDIIAKMPPSALSMTRYGTDIVNHIKGTSLESTFKKDANKDYFKATYNVTTIMDTLNYLAGVGRNEMYTIQENDEYFVKFEASEDYKTGLENTFANYKSNFANMNLTNYVKFVEITKNTSTGKYYCGYYMSVGFIAKIIFGMLNSLNGNSASSLLSYLSYINAPVLKNSGALNLMSVVDGNSLTNAHMPLPYFYFVSGK